MFLHKRDLEMLDKRKILYVCQQGYHMLRV